MMNRSSTEEKVNKNLSKDMLDMTNSLPNSLKCALQFREVCEKELIRIENDSLAGCEKGTYETKTVNLIKFDANIFLKRWIC